MRHPTDQMTTTWMHLINWNKSIKCLIPSGRERDMAKCKLSSHDGKFYWIWSGAVGLCHKFRADFFSWNEKIPSNSNWILFFFWLLTLLGTDDDRWQKLKLNRVRIYLNLKIEFRHERENCYRWAWEDVWGTTKVISSEEYSLEIVFSLVESMLDSSTRVQITVHRNLFINFSFSRSLSLCSLSTILFHFSFLLRSCWNCSDRLSIELNFNNRRLTCFCSSISSESSPVANSFFCLYRV